MTYKIDRQIKSGIYRIINNVDSKVYIGSSKNLFKRFCYHKEDLMKGKHRNPNLQNFVNTFGLDKLTFVLLEECSPAILLEREQFYLDTIKPFGMIGFNVVRKASGGFEKHSEESKRLMSLQRRGVPRGKYSEAHGRATSEGLKKSEKAKKHLHDLHLMRQKTYYFENPKGEMITIVNLKQFCEKHNLSDTKMVAVYNERKISYKGWKKHDGRCPKIPSHYKTVHKYTLEGCLIKTFSSLEKAAKSVNTTNTMAIAKCAAGGRPSYKNFIWSYTLLKNKYEDTL